MVTKISDETEIPAPAAKVWALYGTIHFADFLQLHLPNIINNVELLEGDGGQGTLVLVTFAPGEYITRLLLDLSSIDSNKFFITVKMTSVVFKIIYTIFLTDPN